MIKLFWFGLIVIMVASVCLLWPRSNEYSPLIQVCKYGKEPDITRLLDSGANPNQPGLTKAPLDEEDKPNWERLPELPLAVLLQRAISRQVFDDNLYSPEVDIKKTSYYRLLKALLDHGASPTKLYGGTTPLHDSAESFVPEYVELFLQYAKNIKVRDNEGKTALHNLCEHRVFSMKHYTDSTRYWRENAIRKCVHAFIQAGMPVDVRDSDGKTPLHTAAMKGNLAIAEALIADGADLNAKDIGGLTPLECSLTIEMHDYLVKRQKGE